VKNTKITPFFLDHALLIYVDADARTTEWDERGLRDIYLMADQPSCRQF